MEKNKTEFYLSNLGNLSVDDLEEIISNVKILSSFSIPPTYPFYSDRYFEVRRISVEKSKDGLRYTIMDLDEDLGNGERFIVLKKNES